MIIITRESVYADRLRGYKIEVDGEVIGEVRDGKTESFNIKPGKHIIRIKYSWASSKKIEFKSIKGKTNHFRCVSAITGIKSWFAIVYALLLFRRWIELEQLD